MEASHPLGYGLVVRYLVFTTEITQVRILDLLDKKGCVKLLKGPHLCKCCTNCTWTEVLPNSTWIEFYSHPSKQRAFHQKKRNKIIRQLAMRKVTLSGADTMSRNVSLDKKVDNIDWLKLDIIGQKRWGGSSK